MNPDTLRWLAFTDAQLAEIDNGLATSTGEGQEMHLDEALNLQAEIADEQERRAKTHAGARRGAGGGGRGR